MPGLGDVLRGPPSHCKMLPPEEEVSSHGGGSEDQEGSGIYFPFPLFFPLLLFPSREISSVKRTVG